MYQRLAPVSPARNKRFLQLLPFNRGQWQTRVKHETNERKVCFQRMVLHINTVTVRIWCYILPTLSEQGYGDIYTDYLHC